MINEIYWSALKNRKDALNTQSINRNRLKFKLNSILYFTGIIIKILFSKFCEATVINGTELKISWTKTYLNRLNELSGNIELIEYDYRGYNKNQCSLFKYVRLIQAFHVTLKIKDIENRHEFEQDNFFYRFVISAEFLMFNSLMIKSKYLKRIYIAGINDRQTVTLSELCNYHKINLSVLQHGCFTKFKNQYKLIADEFHYFYDFSIKYLKYFVRNEDKLTLKFLPRKNKIEGLKLHENKINIAYATTPIKEQINFEIIDIILKDLNNDVNLIINTHPHESEKVYQKRYGGMQNVLITRDKFRNVEYFILRYSTLGVEMSQIGIRSVYVNIENYETDFFEFGNVVEFNRLSSFKSWLHNESQVRYYYKKK